MSTPHASRLYKVLSLGSLALATWALAACGPFGPAPAAGSTAAMTATPAGVVTETQTSPATPSATVTAPAVESATTVAGASLRSASYAELSFKYPAGLAEDAQGAAIAADEEGGVPWTKPVPAHIEISLTGYVLPKTTQEARIIVYPAEEFAAANPEAATRIASLQQLLQKGAVEPGASLPFLPLVNALQPMQAGVKFLSFEGGQGVRYVTQLSQGPVPVNNRELFYTYQGLTADGRYYVVALLPVSQSSLPADDMSLPEAEREALATNYKQYVDKTVQALNTQGDDSFTPALSTLDGLVRSIQLSAPTGESLSGQVQWGARPVAGVRVELRKPGWRTNPAPGDVVATALSDAAGQYMFQNPPAGDWSLCAVWPDGEESQGGTPAVQIAAGQVVPTGPDTTLKLARMLKLLEPAFGASVDTSPTLRWEEFPGASGYRLFAGDIGTGGLVLDQVVTGTSFKFTSPLLPGSKYQLSVSALDGTEAQLAIGTSEFWTNGEAPVATPNPAERSQATSPF